MPWWKCFECLRDVDDIRILDFSHHLLHDVPPDVFQYERTLEELHLNANRIVELPRQLFYCQELKVLNLNDNELASLPPAISSLTNLQRLYMYKNALSGIQENIKSCKHLTVLDISLNGFIRLPEPVTSCVSLQELYLNDTSLEFLPANFGRLVNLRILELRDNNLSTLPKSLVRLQQLQRLDIGSNVFTELPEVVGQLVNLTELWLDGNHIRRMSANVGNLTKLVHFEASNNQLTQLPGEVANWTRLQELSISVNDFKQLPFGIGQMRALVALKADENNLQELPDSISQLENLEEIMVSHNDLVRLPASIGLLRRLRFLTADENLLRSLPQELCSCVALTLLSVRGNKLTEVPLDIGHLRNLRVINIVNNFVTHLPVSVLNLQQLSALWISDNQSQPLMPLQKDFGPEQSVRLTCFMLPQTMMPHSSNGGAGKLGGGMTMQEKERLDTLRHLTAKQMAEVDENTAMMPAHGDGHPSVSSPPPANGSAGKRRICFASDPVSATNDAAARLMRSPTPYPKELRILAKYARYVHTNGQTEYVHEDDLRAAAAGAIHVDGSGQPLRGGVCTNDEATAGIELHMDADRQQQQHPMQHHQQQRPLNVEQPMSGDNTAIEVVVNDTIDRDAAVGDDAAESRGCYDEVGHRFALPPPTHLPVNFQPPTMSPLLGDDELDPRAAYFYATAEQKITTPVPQMAAVDYENVSLASSSSALLLAGRSSVGMPPHLLQQQQQQQLQPQSIYVATGGGTINGFHTAERPASEIRMSQTSSFNDGGSLSSAFGLNNGAAATPTLMMNGNGARLPPAEQHQLQQQQQLIYPVVGNGGMKMMQQQQPSPSPQQQLLLHNNGGFGMHSRADEDVVYYAASQGSDSNYGHLPGSNAATAIAWQQQPQPQHQHHQQMQSSPAGASVGGYHVPMIHHLQHQPQYSPQLQQQQLHRQLQHHNADRLSLTSVDYARSDMSSTIGSVLSSQPNRHPPPYHIARAFTKKSKSDLMHYEHFRTQNGSMNGDAPTAVDVGEHADRIATPVSMMGTMVNGQQQQLPTSIMYGDGSQDEPAERDSAIDPHVYYSNGATDASVRHSPTILYANNTTTTTAASPMHEGIHAPRPVPTTPANVIEPTTADTHVAAAIGSIALPPNGIDSNRNQTDLHQHDNSDDDVDSKRQVDAAVARGHNRSNGVIPTPLSTSSSTSMLQQSPHKPIISVGSPPIGNTVVGKSPPWLFGKHRNPKVMQLSVPKTLDIGFRLTTASNGTDGIFVGQVDANSIVNSLLRQHDKVLDMDGVDFTRISLPDALTVLSNAGPVINLMVSRI